MIVTTPLETLDVKVPIRDLFANSEHWKTVPAKGPLSRILGRYKALSVLSEPAYAAEQFIEKNIRLHVTGTKVQAHVTLLPDAYAALNSESEKVFSPAIFNKTDELTATLKHDAMVTNALWHSVDVRSKPDYPNQGMEIDISMTPQLQKHMRKHYAKEAALAA